MMSLRKMCQPILTTSMVIRKKTGYNIDIQLNEAITTINDGKTHLHLDVDAELDKDELMSILKSIGLN